MINSYNSTTQDVVANSNVLFNADRVRTSSCGCCGWLSHDVGSGIFTLTKGGVYEISYNANISSAIVGVASLGLKQNGETIIGTQSDLQITTANDIGSVSASALIRVPCDASYTITLNNISENLISVEDANIIIKRLA